jgi:hypothetical protein
MNPASFSHRENEAGFLFFYLSLLRPQEGYCAGWFRASEGEALLGLREDY